MSSLSFQYAEALYALAIEQKQAQAMVTELESFIHQHQGQMAELLKHPKVAVSDKKAIIDGLKLAPLMNHFLYVLIDNNRLSDIGEILKSYQALIDQQNQVLRAKVYSNKPLSKTELEGIKVALQTKLNRIALLENVIDPTIVGGIKIAYEGNVVDHTINHFIASLSETLKA
jgi:F-type H+-transporting ATPase subunit delta